MKRKYWILVVPVAVLVWSGWQIREWVLTMNGGVLAAATTKTLEERVASLESRVYTLEKNQGLIGTKTTKAKEQYVALLGGEFSSVDWAKIGGTDFTLDTSLYGKTVEVSWQGWIKGVGAVRLYDATNHRVVDFSEFSSTTDTSKSFYTKVMSIWRGQNQYYIEGRTGGGTMVLSSPKLKVVAK